MVKDGSGRDSQAEGLVFVRKTSISLRSTWIQMDVTGHSFLLDVDMYDIMHRVQINARDLRILDPFLSYPSTIIGREKAIVLNLEHIKAIITAEEVLLQDPTDKNVVPVLEELKRRLAAIPTKQGDIQVEDCPGDENESPFEFRVLEVALESICSFLAARTTELEVDAYPALDELTSKISSRNLDKVRKLKSSITRLTSRVQKVRDELERLMDDDDDMADLYLSRKLAGASSPIKASVVTLFGDENDVEELEILLEAYFLQIDGTLNKLTTLRRYIDDTEDYINIQIDSHRNQLIQLELFLNSGHISLAFFSLLTGIFGMNFPFSWNREHGYLFKWVVIFIVACSTVIFLGIIAYARKKGLVG